ncbi:flavin-containing monooxygenase [Patulibacter defluvii]|uniref:flavin-containing monooxygenase n=1 Tax=Patulibacter defluvii TaxID=3095358 RepID=UPI002A75A52F|nr:NAD(P)/FAD-dependent oxidoreductase [Patulibacter sp. DM4]
MPAAPAPLAVPDSYADPVPERVRVAIVGSGFSGLAVGIRLLQEGERDFVILERAGDIGGTWRDNAYPGCACDVPSHLYSFSFAPNPNWSNTFSPQREIWEYQRDVAARFGVNPYVRTNAAVQEARWDEDAQRWIVTTERGTVSAQVLISGTGPLCEPLIPNLPGLDTFEGEQFHSARWNHDYDLRGKRVAVVGTGASAIQFVPRIQPQVGQMTVFQRTPAWVLPRPSRPVTPVERFLYRRFPLLQRAMRGAIYANREMLLFPYKYARPTKAILRAVAEGHMRRQVPDATLRAKVKPNFDVGCKRILISNDYLPALGKSNVEVVTHGVSEVRPNSIVASDGSEREVDAIIFGTGFHVTDQPVAEFVFGRDGKRLADAWAEQGMATFMGTTVSGFPNLFLMVGPNTGQGHTSIIYTIESQVPYVLDALRTLDRNGGGSVDLRPEVQKTFGEEMDRKMRGTVWTAGGCKSWYLDASGRNTTLWPSFTFQMRRRLARFDPSMYRVQPPRTADASTPAPPVAAD